MLSFKKFIVENSQSAKGTTNDPKTSDDVKSIEKTTTTTPRKFTTSTYFDVKQKDITPEQEEEWQKAYDVQREKHGELSPESRFYHAVLHGDPRSPEYSDVDITASLGTFKNPFHYGEKLGKKIVVSSDDAALIGHEVGHVQASYAPLDKKDSSYDQSYVKIKQEDALKPYQDRLSEFGAELKGQIIKTRSNKPPEEALKPLSREEVLKTIEKTKTGAEGMTPFGAWETLPPKTQNELVDYYRHMIVKNQKDRQDGTAIA